MIEFGKTLKAARETKGLTIADVANRTRMMSSMVADLENEDFSHLPAPIYGRGFIKLYCEAVEIDPAPLIAEFTEICNGNREPAIRERPVAAPTMPASEPISPAPVIAPEPPPQEDYDLFSTPTRLVTPTVVPTSEPPPASSKDYARYAAPLRDRVEALPGVLPLLGRWCVVALALLLVLWGVAVGIRTLYRATSATTPTSAVATEDQTSVKRPTPASRPTVKTDRTPLDVPPLYID